MARTASLPSTPEDKVPPNPQSVSNSTTNKMNPKAQSSFDSQKTRATARSKLMEEAKWKGDLLNYTHNLNPRSRNSRRRSANTTKASSTIGRACLDKCTGWTPLLRNQLNLRLQNPLNMTSQRPLNLHNPRFGLTTPILFVLPMQEIFH